MTVDKSKKLKEGTRVYWRGDAADSGIVTETSWDAVIIAWNNGQVASVHHGDMRRDSADADKAASCDKGSIMTRVPVCPTSRCTGWLSGILSLAPQSPTAPKSQK